MTRVAALSIQQIAGTPSPAVLRIHATLEQCPPPFPGQPLQLTGSRQTLLGPQFSDPFQQGLAGESVHLRIPFDLGDSTRSTLQQRVALIMGPWLLIGARPVIAFSRNADEVVTFSNHRMFE